MGPRESFSFNARIYFCRGPPAVAVLLASAFTRFLVLRLHLLLLFCVIIIWNAMTFSASDRSLILCVGMYTHWVFFWQKIRLMFTDISRSTGYVLSRYTANYIGAHLTTNLRAGLLMILTAKLIDHY